VRIKTRKRACAGIWIIVNRRDYPGFYIVLAKELAVLQLDGMDISKRLHFRGLEHIGFVRHVEELGLPMLGSMAHECA